MTGRVVDQANIIPDDREAALVQRLEQLQRQSSRQLVIATIANLESHPIEDYGYRLGRHWGIGQSEANNGILLIIAPNERRVRIEVGYGLEPIMTDALSTRIINDEILARFRQNDVPGGIEAGANAIIAQLAAPPEAAEQRALEAERARQNEGGRAGGFPFEIIVWLVILGFFVVPAIIGAVSPSHRRRRRRYGADVIPWGVGWGGGSSSSSWGGSSWGGGGGSSWGGGGGGFSGGGGSFGGGGASGGW